MAFAATASATTLTSPVGTTYTGAVKASSTGITTHYFVGPSTATCASSTMEGNVESHGALVPVVVKLSNLSFSTCNFSTVGKKAGVLELHSDGTVTSTGAEIVVTFPIGGPQTLECVYTTNHTKIGTFSGGTPAHINLGSAIIPRTGGNFACGQSSTWTGEYTITTPVTLLVD
jgi:hypothetical protein